MNTKIYSSLLFSLLALGALQPVQAQMKPCGTTEMWNKQVAQHPEIMDAQRQLDADIKEYKRTHQGQRTQNQVYIIPIVFHVIHQNGSENISDAQIQDAVNILNKDYRRLNADTSAIVAQFKPIAADCEIEFRLAQIDPEGNCTNGIDRIYSHETNVGDDGSKLNPWPRDKYLNVWTVRTMENGVAGYAYYPSATAGILFPYDGVIILSDYIGSIGTSNPTNSRALTHEIGHYLNLPHTWGNNNNPGVACGDDGIFDTPETKGWTTCNLNGAACDPSIVENVQNYMEYSYCSKMFTEGQKAQMLATLNSAVSARNNLWSAANLAATGVLNQPVALCAPVAEFHSSAQYTCEGGTLNFFDDSYNGAVSSRTWTFSNATPSTSTSANPVVTFNAGGVQTVTLTVSNATGTDTKTKTAYIYVSPAYQAIFGASTEGFENAGNFSSWLVRNDDNDAVSWQRVTNAGATGTSSILVNNYSNDGGSIDEIITPAYDLSTTTSLGMSFKYSGATRESNAAGMTDELRIYSSTDCGETWIQRNSISGISLVNAGYWGSYYVPDSPSLWNTHTFSLAPSLAQSNVRFKFRFVGGSGNGNNLYIDDINITGVTGVNEVDAAGIYMQVFPNPSNGSFTIQYSNAQTSDITVSLYDITGRTIYKQVQGQQPAGEHLLSIDKAQHNLTPGVYFVEVQKGSVRKTQKLVITN